MRPLAQFFALLASLLMLPAASTVSAATSSAAASVEAVQAPAWRERNGQSVPLTPGMELKGSDVVRTGPGARAYLLLAEGSRVKLGESARFALHSRRLQPRSLFRGVLDVLEGAFRFTTGKVTSRRHDVAIRVGTATIGIRGTDLWGRSNSEGDLVALLEGKIEITRGGEVTALTQPMSYYDAPRGKASAVKALDPEVFRALARQTEIEAGDGAARSTGKWRVLAGASENEGAALELYDRIREAGFAARIRPQAREAEGWNYDVLIGNFASADEAAVAADRLKALTGLAPKVVR